jgi:hypothetical protein
MQEKGGDLGEEDESWEMMAWQILELKNLQLFLHHLGVRHNNYVP